LLLGWLEAFLPISADFAQPLVQETRDAATSYLISVQQPIISITSPSSLSSGKIDVITHIGSCSGKESSICWAGAFHLFLRRNSNDLVIISFVANHEKSCTY
jgi:hypothetical protein